LIFSHNNNLKNPLTKDMGMRNNIRLPLRSVFDIDVSETVVNMRILYIKMDKRCLDWRVPPILFLMIILFVGCGGAGSQNSKGDPARPGGAGKAGGPAVSAVPVKTTHVQRISIQRTVDLAGSLVSIDQAKVSSEVGGVVKQVLVELGQEVRAGQIIVKLDPRELELALQRAQSQFRQTQAQLGIDGERIKEPPPDEQIASVRMAIANLDDALAQLRRAQRLRSQNLLPQADLDAAETRVKVTEANYQAALESVQSLKATLQERRHAVELAEMKLSDTDIRSSIAGQVSERLVQQGEYIRENTPVVSIVQVNPLKVKTAIQERYASLVSPGMLAEFEVEASPGRKFQGKVAYVSPSVDPTTRTFPIEILVDNSDRRLKPGFFAKGVIFTHRDEDVMAVSENAIFTLAGISNVYIIENNKARQQIVTPRTRIGDLVEITSGLTGEEVLATSNLNLLATGVPVSVEQSEVSEGSAGGQLNSVHEENPEGSGQGGQP
jgi:RND family efflux transporter MFP subunit